MSKQALVVGLGQFGLALSRSLAAKGVEVLAVDRREETVRAAASFVTEAVCLDATDEISLARTLPERRDLCVCAIGDESRESSILVTALLRQLGAKRLVARQLVAPGEAPGAARQHADPDAHVLGVREPAQSAVLGSQLLTP